MISTWEKHGKDSHTEGQHQQQLQHWQHQQHGQTQTSELRQMAFLIADYARFWPRRSHQSWLGKSPENRG